MYGVHVNTLRMPAKGLGMHCPVTPLEMLACAEAQNLIRVRSPKKEVCSCLSMPQQKSISHSLHQQGQWQNASETTATWALYEKTQKRSLFYHACVS